MSLEEQETGAGGRRQEQAAGKIDRPQLTLPPAPLLFQSAIRNPHSAIGRTDLR